jgi:hypothetical protein
MLALTTYFSILISNGLSAYQDVWSKVDDFKPIFSLLWFLKVMLFVVCNHKKNIVYDIHVREIKIETGWGNIFQFLSVLTLCGDISLFIHVKFYFCLKQFSTVYWLVPVADGWLFRFIHIWLCSMYIQQCFEMSHWKLPFSRLYIPAYCMPWVQNCIKSDTKLHVPYPQQIACVSCGPKLVTCTVVLHIVNCHSV